ncbi:NSUN5 [Hepatospora eriocheir]|uniref:NSUN5 n=1 Tax=Hepatospora eriocheir TaxID=1081669 RepID=A0A1X0QF94_9MICR|nr:NSUN5 [Hepatospora eriocheir]
MNNTGKIIAVERNLNRYKTLKSMIKEFGTKNVETIHKDFLKIEPSSIKADYILLDPSCSGSGIHDDYKKIKKE